VTERPGHDEIKPREYEERLEHDGEWLRPRGEQDHAYDRSGRADRDPTYSFCRDDVDVWSPHCLCSAWLISYCQLAL
jgi:hypothetical protein